MKLHEFKDKKWGIPIISFVIITSILQVILTSITISFDLFGHGIMPILLIIFGSLGFISGLLFIFVPIITHVRKNFVIGLALAVGFFGICNVILFIIVSSFT
ncbi:MAG: hypothetical protein KAS47_03045 [Candidatus Heimdallarchaeota archaeon]|nr:hypothetical protein [Candidatus Heimdallarchaeota archaeon]